VVATVQVQSTTSHNLSQSEPSIEDFLSEARSIFGGQSPWVYNATDNLQIHDTTEENYGWGPGRHVQVVEKDCHGKSFPRYEGDPLAESSIKLIRNTRGRSKRYQVKQVQGLIGNDDVHNYFYDTIKRQSEIGPEIQNIKTGEIIRCAPGGKWSTDQSIYLRHVRKKLKKRMGRIEDAILLTLDVYQTNVLNDIHEKGLNIHPVEYAIMNIWGWANTFLKRLRDHQRVRKIKWAYVGAVLEMQGNGYPHLSLIFRSRTVGKIAAVAKLWDWCPPQGVDYTNRRKVEKKKGHKVDNLHLVNYLTTYVSKANQKQFYDAGSLSKSWSLAAYYGVRTFNLGRSYYEPKIIKPREWVFVGSYNVVTGESIPFTKKGGYENEQNQFTSENTS
jgi:hypothetical protein